MVTVKKSQFVADRHGGTEERPFLDSGHWTVNRRDLREAKQRTKLALSRVQTEHERRDCDSIRTVAAAEAAVS